MKIGSIIRIAFRAIFRNKMRSLLTALGIIIGVASVIAMVGIGNGAQAQVEAQIQSLGENVILIFSGSTTSSGIRTGWGSAGTLTIEDAEAIKREIPQVVAISPEIRSVSQIVGGTLNWYTQILGESPDYFNLRQWPFIYGGSFSEQDVRSANKVAVIGSTVAQQLFGDVDPLGQVLRIKNVPFLIVGVLSRKGLSMNGVDQDDVVIVPYTSAMKRLTGATVLRSINAQVGSGSDLYPAQTQIISLLRQRHRIGPGKDDDFTVRNQEEIAAAATQTAKVMSILLGSIASVSLVVGGIGIMNIMLVSVTERTREIGIRMALGARARDVLMQFLVEAVSLSTLGGLAGVAFGIAASKILSNLANWPTLISMTAILIAFAFSGAVGVFFGYYPAWKASRLDPIEALRYE